MVTASCDNAVEELLASAGKVEAFIEKPAYAVIADTLAGDVTHSPVEGKRIGQYRVVRNWAKAAWGRSIWPSAPMTSIKSR